MSKSLHTAFLQWLSASFVALAGMIIGKGVAQGLSTQQWGYACLILSASILLATMVWMGDPKVVKAKDRDER